jgi:hypothetical protein
VCFLERLGYQRAKIRVSKKPYRHRQPTRAAMPTAEPRWMKKAEQAAHTLHATTKRQSGAGHSVYVVLLYNPTRREPWGVYVGQTSRAAWQVWRRARLCRCGGRQKPNAVYDGNPIVAARIR